MRSALEDDGFQGSWAAAVVLRWREVPRAPTEAGAQLEAGAGADAGAAGGAAALAAGRYAYDIEYTEFVLDSGEKMVAHDVEAGRLQPLPPAVPAGWTPQVREERLDSHPPSPSPSPSP